MVQVTVTLYIKLIRIFVIIYNKMQLIHNAKISAVELISNIKK